MNLNYFQEESKKTAKYPQQGNNIYYPALGLGGESGEVLNIITKIMKNNNVIDDATKDKLIDELGDVMWYIATLCTELEITLDEVAFYNIEKLKARQSSEKK